MSSRSETYRLDLGELKKAVNRRIVCFHLLYHPDNPPAYLPRQLWREYIFSLQQGKLKLN